MSRIADEATHRPPPPLEEITVTAVSESPAAASRSDVECTGCTWTYLSATHTGRGTSDRPGNAAYVDDVMPVIGEHIDATRHQVRVTITTYWQALDDERSSILIGPRIAAGQTQ